MEGLNRRRGWSRHGRDRAPPRHTNHVRGYMQLHAHRGSRESTTSPQENGIIIIISKKKERENNRYNYLLLATPLFYTLPAVYRRRKNMKSLIIFFFHSYFLSVILASQRKWVHCQGNPAASRQRIGSSRQGSNVVFPEWAPVQITSSLTSFYHGK